MELFQRSPAALIQGVAPNIGEDLDPVPASAAQELIDRQVDRFAQDVPEGDVDGAYGCAEGGTHKVGVP